MQSCIMSWTQSSLCHPWLWSLSTVETPRLHSLRGKLSLQRIQRMQWNISIPIQIQSPVDYVHISSQETKYRTESPRWSRRFTVTVPARGATRSCCSTACRRRPDWRWPQCTAGRAAWSSGLSGTSHSTSAAAVRPRNCDWWTWSAGEWGTDNIEIISSQEIFKCRLKYNYINTGKPDISDDVEIE